MQNYRHCLLFLSLLSGGAFSCDLNSAAPLTTAVKSVHDSQEPRKVLLSNNIQLSLPEAPGLLQMHSAESLTLLAQVSVWPTPTGDIAAIKAQPAVVDFNYDGSSDAVYVVDAEGLVWFLSVDGSGFSAPVLIADFTALNAEFNQPLQIVQFTTTSSPGVMVRQQMIFLIASISDGSDILLAVKHQRQSSDLIDITAMTDRTDVTADEQRYGISEQLWQTLQQGSGWYIRLAQKVTALPQVYAGVVYFAAADANTVNNDCTFNENSAAQLYAVHMHHAGLVYANRQWLIESLNNARLTLTRNTEGQLQLQQLNDGQQQTVINDLLAISEACADCVAELNAAQFPRLIRLATFQTEPGAH